MTSRSRRLPLAGLMLLLAPFAAPSFAADEAVHRQQVMEDFDTVRFGIESAIQDRGYVIDYHARIGQMLERTAADVGADGSPYLHAETWQFCSAVLSRRMMEADPANVAYCPYVVFAYETVDAPGTVVVGFRSPTGASDSASDEILAEVDRELSEIVADAL